MADGTVYIVAGLQSSTSLFAFDATGGALRFQSPVGAQWEQYLAPTVGDHAIYTNAGDYGEVYAIDATGHQFFRIGGSPQQAVTPAVDRLGVYHYYGSQLRVIEPSTGILIETITDPTWRDFARSVSGSAVLGAPGSLFLANYGNAITDTGMLLGNTLLNFDVLGGTVKWQVLGYYPSTPAYRAGVLYAANDSPLRLEARSEASGGLSWSWTLPQAGGYQVHERGARDRQSRLRVHEPGALRHRPGDAQDRVE